MKGINGKPYVDLDSLLPLDVLDIEAIELELAVSKRSHNLWGHSHPRDFSFFRAPPQDASQQVRDFYEQHKDDQHIVQLYAKLAYGVYSPTVSVRVSQFKGPHSAMSQLTVDDPEQWERDLTVFPSVHKFIDACGAFESTGRINFFINEHNCEIPMHNDWVHPQSNNKVGYNAVAEKEFLWLNPRQIKALYVFDEKARKKHPITSKSAWFNSLDLHGGDASARAAWTLRIDGVFTKEFRERISTL